MNESVSIIGVFIPIIFILVTGLVLVTFYYFRSRERQLLIDKGLSTESIKEFFEHKRDPFRLMKIGIILIAFGLGLGIGLMLKDATNKGFYVAFSIFVFTGLGFVIANKISNKNDLKIK